MSPSLRKTRPERACGATGSRTTPMNISVNAWLARTESRKVWKCSVLDTHQKDIPGYRKNLHCTHRTMRYGFLPCLLDMFDKSHNGKYFEDVPLTHDADEHPLVRDDKGNWKEAKRDKEGNWILVSTGAGLLVVWWTITLYYTILAS